MTFSALDSDLLAPLFASEAMRDCFSDRARLKAMLTVEAALARAQAGLGIVSESLAVAIESISPDELDAGAIGHSTALSGVPTIPFIKAVQAILPPDLERDFHKGATTQDILDTAMVLQWREALALVAADLAEILDALAQMALRYRETVCVGRTYGQHAAPITFGFKVAVWLAGIAEVASALPALRKRILVASLAGPVGTLAGLGGSGGAVFEAFARELGLGSVAIAWHARRGRVAEAGCWLAGLIGTLGKMATDVADLTSTEVAEVAEPFVPGRGGSSAMPHKRNPISCTVILAAHGAAPGLAATLLNAMAAAHERPAGLWHAEWHALPSLFGLASGALGEARNLALGLDVNPGRMAANLDITKGLLFADAAASLLSAKLGREEAHALVQDAAEQVRRTGKGLLSVLLESPQVRIAQVDLKPAFDLANSIKAACPWIDRAVAEAANTAIELRRTGAR